MEPRGRFAQIKTGKSLLKASSMRIISCATALIWFVLCGSVAQALRVTVDPSQANGTTVFATLHAASEYISNHNDPGVDDRIDVMVDRLEENDGICGYDWGDRLTIDGDGDRNGTWCTVVVGNNGTFKGNTYNCFFLMDISAAAPWQGRYVVKNFVLIPKFIAANQNPPQVYSVFEPVMNFHQNTQGSVLFDNIVVTASLPGDEAANPFIDQRSMATRWGRPFVLTARTQNVDARLTRIDIRNTLVSQTKGFGGVASVLYSHGDDQLIYLGPGFAALYCDGSRLIDVRRDARKSCLEIAGLPDNRNLFLGNSVTDELLNFEVEDYTLTRGWSRIAFTDFIDNSATAVARTQAGLGLIDHCLFAENAAMSDPFVLASPSEKIAPEIKIKDCTFFNMGAGSEIMHFGAGNFAGIGFRTNIATGPRTATFGQGLFAGNGADHDYVGIYPLHRELAAPLFTDSDGALASLTKIDGNNCVVGEDTGAIIGGDGTFVMTFDPLDIKGVDSVSVTLAAAAPRTNTYPNSGSYQSDLSVWLIVDGGPPFEIGRFRGDKANDFTTNMALDADMDGVGEGTRLTSALRDFSFSSAISGDSLQVQIRMTSDQNQEEIVYDNVRIESSSFNVSQSFEGYAGLSRYIFENVIYAAGSNETAASPATSDVAVNINAPVILRRCVFPESGPWRLRPPYGETFPPAPLAEVGWANLNPMGATVFENCSNADPQFVSDDPSDYPLPDDLTSWQARKITLDGCDFLKPTQSQLPFNLAAQEIVKGALADDRTPVDTGLWRVRPLAQSYRNIWVSSDASQRFAEKPRLALCPTGRLVASMTYTTNSNQLGVVYTSDDKGQNWVHRRTFRFVGGRPFVAGDNLYILGCDPDLVIMRSSDWGDTWEEPRKLSLNERWYGAAANVHYEGGQVYLVMSRHLDRAQGTDPDRVADLAPVLMRAAVGDDLTLVENWTFAEAPSFVDLIDDKALDDFGVPYYPAYQPETYTVAEGRLSWPSGWLDGNVTRILDSTHYWHGADEKTFHLLLRAQTGGAGYGALLKVVEHADGSMATSLEEAPSGVTTTFLPLPGGQSGFCILYDEPTGLYWLLSTQTTDAMIWPEQLPSRRAGLPAAESRRLALHFSRNLVDWCFGGLVAFGPADQASRTDASMVIDGDDLHVICSSGDLQAMDSDHCNRVTFHTVRDFRRLADYLVGTSGVNSVLPAVPDADDWRVRPLANAYTTLWHATAPRLKYRRDPALARCPNGRLIASGGEIGIYTSDDHGLSWEFKADHNMSQARPFVAGQSLYLLGHKHDLTILRSDDWGETWDAFPSYLTSGQEWHQAPCNVHYANGYVYIVMERQIPNQLPNGWWYVSELAPVLMRGKVNDDLRVPSNWTFASQVPFYNEIDDRALQHLGIPFYPGYYPDRHPIVSGRIFYPAGWLETNVVQFVDPAHQWYDPAGRTFHLFARTHSGRSNLAHVMKVIENDDGSMTTMAQTAPSGVKMHYVPMPGGHIKFHVLYDEETRLYWLLSSQATDSMKRAEMLPEDRFDLPTNERERLQLHFSRNMMDWCFAGLVAVGESSRAARHYASMVIDGDDLLILSRSGDETAKDAHNGNILSLHTIRNFRALAYLDDPYGLSDEAYATHPGRDAVQDFESNSAGLGYTTNLDPAGSALSTHYGPSSALFIGNGVMRDYYGVYPLHTQTDPPLFTDEDGALASITPLSGERFIAGEDTRARSLDGDRVTMRFEPVDISSADEVAITLAAAAPRSPDAYANAPDSVSDLSLWIAVDEAPPLMIGRFRGDAQNDYTTNLSLDTDLDGVGDSVALSSAFQDFTFSAPVSGSALRAEVQLQSCQNDQEIAFDHVRITPLVSIPASQTRCQVPFSLWE
ncbi:MAG TPA: hypothetical protein PLS90_11380 [Candidatus Sumerlaeota bacterium]|nr:hypothetical protein [Candidatus Sumerlaeota bacterium]